MVTMVQLGAWAPCLKLSRLLLAGAATHMMCVMPPCDPSVLFCWQR